MATTALLAAAAPAAAAASNSARGFALKSGDRVCFYGDSITEQRFYPAIVETYVLTRFPDLHVRFVDAGVGGDRVTGGWAGPIDLRLARDVFPFHPNVVTIMLGMNDAGYRPFDQKLFDQYRAGYEHIIASLQQHLPGVRIVLLETSPYDDIAQPPKFPGGYSAVLDRYDAFVRQLGSEHHLLVVDFNTPMVAVLRRAEAINPELAKQIFPGRIHPSAAAEMMMAQALLQAWGAPALVSDVALDAQSASVARAENASVRDLRAANGGLSWTETEAALPLPVEGLHSDWRQFPPVALFPNPQPRPGYTNPVTALIDQLSGFTRDLDQETLRVSGLAAGTYSLAIDGDPVAKYSADDLARGVNLAQVMTPMMRQAYDVNNLVWEEIQAHFVAWHGVQTALQGYLPFPLPAKLPLTTENDPAAAQAVKEVLRAMHQFGDSVRAHEHIANQPAAHQFALTPVA